MNHESLSRRSMKVANMKDHEPYQQVEGFSGNTMWSSMHSDGQVQWVLSMSAVGNLRES